MTERRRAWIWAGFVLCCLLVLGWHLHRGVSLKTDLLDVFPRTEEKPLLEILQQFMEGTSSRQVLIRLQVDPSAGGERIRSLRRVLDRSLRSEELFRNHRVLGHRNLRRAYFDFYFPHRQRLLAPEIRRALRGPDPVGELANRVQQYLYGSRSPLVARLLDRDPLLLFPQLVQYWRSLGGAGVGPGGDNGSGVAAVAELRSTPFRVSTQVEFERFFTGLKSSLRSTGAVESVSWTGVVRFAKTMRERMRRDLNLLGLLSTAIVVLLILWVFRDWVHLVFLLVSVAVGFTVACSVTLLVWRTPHVMTLVFSTSLIGVCVDYSFHYFLEASSRSDSTASPLKVILPGITLGLLTTLLGYVGLGFTPLPLLRQMAFFSSVGLLGAFGTVVFWFPVGMKTTGVREPAGGLTSLARGILDPWRRILGHPLRVVALLGLLLLVVVGGLSGLSVTDDLRDIQTTPRSLVETDRVLRRQTGLWNTGRVLLVTRSRPQQLLRTLESLHPRIRRWKREGVIGSYRSIDPFLPSLRRQKQNRELLRSSLAGQKSRFIDRFSGLGFPRSTLLGFWGRLEERSGDYIRPRDWLGDPVSFGLRSLWFGKTSRGYTSLVMLRGIRDESLLRDRIRGLTGVHYVNRLRAFNRILGRYRRQATVLLAVAYVVILLVLILRYGWVGGVLTSTPSLIGVGLALTVLSLAGISFNLTHVLAVLLLLGIGIDYGIFLREARRQGRDVAPTFSAIVMSALTTTATFGFLGFSTMKMLQSIGWTVFSGLIFVTLLSPVVLASGSDST